MSYRKRSALIENGLAFPFQDSPNFGEVVEVASGILWLRLPLPFRLDHVNIYLIEDNGGWAILDTGIASDECKQVWSDLFAGPLSSLSISKVIVSHYHPDHIGLAGWLCERLDVPLFGGQLGYLACQNILLTPGALGAKPYRDFYLNHGTTKEVVDRIATSGHAYLKMVSPLPTTFQRVAPGDILDLGGRQFVVMVGEGHSPEQLMFYSSEDDILFAGDQVIEKITPNVSVWAVDPDGDPLGLYLRSLEELLFIRDERALILAGHRRPFIGLRERCKQIIEHHKQRCDMIRSAVTTGSRSPAELVPLLFPRLPDARELGFAFSEALAHVNYLVRRGELCWENHGAERRVRLQ